MYLVGYSNVTIGIGFLFVSNVYTVLMWKELWSCGFWVLSEWFDRRSIGIVLHFSGVFGRSSICLCCSRRRRALPCLKFWMKENFPKLRYVMFGNYTVFEFVSFEGGCLKITSLCGL